jgi:hypothetical protein
MKPSVAEYFAERVDTTVDFGMLPKTRMQLRRKISGEDDCSAPLTIELNGHMPFDECQDMTEVYEISIKRLAKDGRS